MARCTFISYKYNEAQDLRDRLIDSLGDDANYYRGENSDSPDLADAKTERIKDELKDMLHGCSVTMFIVSPNLTLSNWIDWEIEYSLREYTRDERTSRTNGIVGVVQKINNSYDWFLGSQTYPDGHVSRTIADDYLYNIIRNNRYNCKEPAYVCEQCKTVSVLDGSYISLITEDDFIDDPEKYIENAYEKSLKIGEFNLCKTR